MNEPSARGEPGASAPGAPRPDLTKVPPPPREPSERARDLIFRYQGGQWVMLIVGIVFLVVGSLFTLVFAWGLPGELLLDISGERAEGTVVSAELDPHYRINKRVATRVKIEYLIGHKRFETDAITTDADFLERAQVGGRVAVRYLASDPSIARAEGQSYSFFGHIGIFVLIFPVVGGAVAFFAVRSNRREIRAFTSGDAALARVAFVGLDHSTTVNGRHPTVVRWEFDLDGRPFSGELSAMDPEKLGALTSLSEIIVLHDRDDPQVNTAWVE